MRKKKFSNFSFQNFFRFWAKIISDFRRKIFKNLSKLPSACPEEQFVAWNFFKKFWIVLHFCRNLWLGSQISIYMSRVKIAEETVFFFSFQKFFGFWAKLFSDFRPKNFIKFSKLPSTSPEEQFVAWNFFKKFWIVLHFCRNLWLGSQISIYMSRVKIAEETVFFFSFQKFFGFWAKLFSDFRPKNFIKFSKLPSTSPEEQFVAWNFFLKFWIVLDFLQKPSAWFSNFYLRVKSKNCGRNIFLIFLFKIFSDFERKFFQSFGEKSSKSCQNYLLHVQRNNLWLEIFLKVLNRFGFSAETFGLVLKCLSTCPEYKLRKKQFSYFSFQKVFGFWAKVFSDFRPKNFIKFSKLTSTSPEEQFVAWNFFLKFWIVLDFLQKPSAWFSNFYLRVQSKNCGRSSFLIFLFRVFLRFWAIIRSDFRR